MEPRKDANTALKTKDAYPVVMTQGEKFIVVFIPDFNINTQGVDIPDAIEMARDAIGIMGIDMQDDGEPLPEASSLEEIRGKFPDDVVIPSWLNFEAEKAGVNFSAVLQAALKSTLNITDRP